LFGVPASQILYNLHIINLVFFLEHYSEISLSHLFSLFDENTHLNTKSDFSGDLQIVPTVTDFFSLWSQNKVSNFVDRNHDREHQQMWVSWALSNGSETVQGISPSKLGSFALWECSGAISRGRFLPAS